MKQIFIVISMLLCFSTAHAASQFDFLLSQVRTSTTSLAGGKVYFYSPGTTTAKNIWLDTGEATLAANPYTLDSNGTALLYGSGTYRIVIKDAAGVTKYDRDNILSSGDPTAMSITGVDATASNQTYSLPARGVITIVKTDSTIHTVTIQPTTGGQTIMGAANYILTLYGESATLGLSGTTWFIQ